MMILGLISQELHEQLLDSKNYQNRTNGVEELKFIISELDLKPVPSDSIEEFIDFLCCLLDDSNFKVFYGTLQVINLLIQKLDSNLDQYFKQIALVAVKALGDTHTVTRTEYMKAFRQLIRVVGPHKVLDLIIGRLSHKNSRVREDVLNIITAAMLTHHRREFNIPKLCFEVAPYLADGKQKVRQAALELFAVFDHCLDTGKKQPLTKAVDRVELNEDVEGLMAAVQARRARHILPRLSSEGTVEYALVVPKPGQRCSPQFSLGADLEWVLHGGRVSSARSYRSEPDSDRLFGYGSLGSLTDDLPLQRRIASAGKGKNKLPWEMSSLSSCENDQPCSLPNGKSSEKIGSEDYLSISRRLSPETYVPSFASEVPEKRHSGRRRESPARLRRSGSLDLDPEIFKSINFSETHSVTPKACIIPGNPGVERTFSLPTNPNTPGSFLLPSYPLAALPGGLLTPTLSRRRVDSSLSMSNTWPNKREGSLYPDPGPWRDTAGKGKGDQTSSRCSPRPLRATPVSCSSAASSYRRAPNSMKATLPVSPVLPGMERSQSHNGQRSNAPGSERGLDQDLGALSLVQRRQDDEPLDMEEMLNSLRSLRNSAAKKRAKVSLSGSEQDLDSPDSAVKLELGLDSPSRGSPAGVISPASESGLSSLCSPPNSTAHSGADTSPRNSGLSKPHAARVPSGKLRSSVSMDFSCLQSSSQRDKTSPEVGVIGQRVTYSNGPMDFEDGERTIEASPPLVRPNVREPIRAMRPTKGSQGYSSRSSPASDMPEGVVGRGVFGSAVFTSRSSMAASPSELGDYLARPPGDLPTQGICGRSLTGTLNPDTRDNTEDHTERLRNGRFSREKLRSQRPDQAGEEAIISGDRQLNGGRPPSNQTLWYEPKHEEMLFDSRDDSHPLPMSDRQLNGNTLTSAKESPVSPTSPLGSQSPLKCFTPPHQPSPPTVPPNNPKTSARLRRAPSLNRTRPSLSHSSDELSQGSLGQKRDLTEPPELRPFSKPELAMTQSFRLISSDDWEKKIEGLTFLRSLAQYHVDTLQTRLHDVCLALVQEVKNLRSGVSRVAVCTLGDLYSRLQRAMDQELEGTARALLHKAAESNAFIRQDVDAALGHMVQHCTPTRCVNAFLVGGLSHLNAAVRKCAAQHLADLLEKVGVARLLSGGKDVTDRILPAVVKLAQDSSQEARHVETTVTSFAWYFGRRMLLFLSSHQDFDKILEKYIPAKDLPTVRDTVSTLKTKGLGEMPQDPPSARGRRSLPGSGTVRASSLTREPLKQTTTTTTTRNMYEMTLYFAIPYRESNSQCSSKSQGHSFTDKREYIKQLHALLESKDFRERIKGIDQLVADCQTNPSMVVDSLFPVFDAFKDRLQESNSKVNLYALESLQEIVRLLKDNLSQVVNILVPAIVDNHLNSKNNAVYSAATGAIGELMLNLDNVLLLQPFCTKAQFLSGKAKVDLIEKVAELVTELYPRRPQLVEQKALPLLWYLLGTSSHSGTAHGRAGSMRSATANLCHALHSQMGPRPDRECRLPAPEHPQGPQRVTEKHVLETLKILIDHTHIHKRLIK
ncbi:TOG array regulator of axonemal microtubules protein 1 [Merluccius polli]|uniref:TOG array regulator of axonemal microtubules protein 1 n=1 Tax=Merluccius polli TaxID=89951 RepID=A0AA47N7I3_MERPO|nr:TOG array regulator of axonemal microtubules protein 1 [Merluccius polli]